MNKKTSAILFQFLIWLYLTKFWLLLFKQFVFKFYIFMVFFISVCISFMISFMRSLRRLLKTVVKFSSYLANFFLFCSFLLVIVLLRHLGGKKWRMSVFHGQFLISYILFLYLNFEVCYITCDYGDLRIRNTTLCFYILFWHFFVFCYEIYLFIISFSFLITYLIFLT